MNCNVLFALSPLRTHQTQAVQGLPRTFFTIACPIVKQQRNKQDIVCLPISCAHQMQAVQGVGRFTPLPVLSEKQRRSKQDKKREENPKERTRTYVTEGCRNAPPYCAAYALFLITRAGNALHSLNNSASSQTICTLV